MRSTMLIVAILCMVTTSAGVVRTEVSVPVESLGCRLLGSCRTREFAQSVAVTGQHAYVADGAGLAVIDVSDSGNPSLVAYCDDVGYVCDVAVAGDYAYVTATGAGLRVIDVSDPANPHEVASCSLYVYAVAVAGGYAYLLSFDGLRVIDISDPRSPRQVGYCAMPRSAYDVAVAGNYAYLAAFSSGLRVIDVADPRNPYEVGFSRNWLLYTFGVAVDGTWAYGADVVNGLVTVDVTDPRNPLEVGRFYPLYGAMRVAVAGASAYLVNQNNGMRVIDVADPQNPHEDGYYETPGTDRDVAAIGTIAYVADGGAGLQIIEFYGGGATEERKKTEVKRETGTTVVRGVLYVGLGTRSELPGRNSVMSRAVLLDATGRKVKELQAGPNDVRHVAPGVYFVREQSAFSSQHSGLDASRVTKVIVAR